MCVPARSTWQANQRSGAVTALKTQGSHRCDMQKVMHSSRLAAPRLVHTRLSALREEDKGDGLNRLDGLVCIKLPVWRDGQGRQSCRRYRLMLSLVVCFAGMAWQTAESYSCGRQSCWRRGKSVPCHGKTITFPQIYPGMGCWGGELLGEA